MDCRSSIMAVENESLSRTMKCAACKYLGRICSEKCTFYPYFPSTNPNLFAMVDRIFGAENFDRLMQEVPVNQRVQSASCMLFSAYMRIKDPVYGITRILIDLERQIRMYEQELAMLRGELGWPEYDYMLEEQQQLPCLPSFGSDPKL